VALRKAFTVVQQLSSAKGVEAILKVKSESKLRVVKRAAPAVTDSHKIFGQGKWCCDAGGAETSRQKQSRQKPDERRRLLLCSVPSQKTFPFAGL